MLIGAADHGDWRVYRSVTDRQLKTASALWPSGNDKETTDQKPNQKWREEREQGQKEGGSQQAGKKAMQRRDGQGQQDGKPRNLLLYLQDLISAVNRHTEKKWKQDKRKERKTSSEFLSRNTVQSMGAGTANGGERCNSFD